MITNVHKSKFKVGDKFIITGNDEDLILWSLMQYKGTVRIVKGFEYNSDECLYFQNPVSSESTSDWQCPINCAIPLSKLHKALA